MVGGEERSEVYDWNVGVRIEGDLCCMGGGGEGARLHIVCFT